MTVFMKTSPMLFAFVPISVHDHRTAVRAIAGRKVRFESSQPQDLSCTRTTLRTIELFLCLMRSGVYVQGPAEVLCGFPVSLCGEQDRPQTHVREVMIRICTKRFSEVFLRSLLVAPPGHDVPQVVLSLHKPGIDLDRPGVFLFRVEHVPRSLCRAFDNLPGVLRNSVRRFLL